MEITKSKRNIKPFNGEKYSVWKFRMRTLLAESDVLDVIDEEETQDWEKKNRIAKSIIVEYLSDSFLGFAKEKSARQILKRLDELYERKSIATQLALRKKLLLLKLKADESLTKHFTNFDDILSELLAAGAVLEETDKIAHLLLTLPTTYDGVITAIETLSEDNLTLAFVKTRLLDHEVKLKDESSDTSAKVLHANKNWHNNKAKMNMIIKCFHCGRKGHKKLNCHYFKKSQQYSDRTERNRTIQAIELVQSSGDIPDAGFAFMAGWGI